jgi:phosphatidate cytidylyltransferase
MLRTRLLTAVVLIPIVVYCMYLGKWAFLALVALLLTLAEVEFCRLMARDGFHTTLAFGLGLVWLSLLDAYLPALELLRPGLALILLLSLAWQLFHRQGSPVADWALTVAGGLYLGLYGSYLIRLRDLSDGFWWTLTTVFAIMIADSGAYFVGRVWGRRKMTPTLSPGKTWEGYATGVITGGLLTALLVLFWHTQAGASVATSVMHGLVLGLLISTFAPLGDLAISMIKRQVGVKDSGSIIPGHGGALDRMDSILWAAVIGYHYILWFAT